MNSNITDLTTLIGSAATITSLQVAEAARKRHNNVMRDIRNTIETLGERASSGLFSVASYPDKYGKQRPMYVLTPQATFMLLSFYSPAICLSLLSEIEAETGSEPLERALAAFSPVGVSTETRREASIRREQLTSLRKCRARAAA